MWANQLQRAGGGGGGFSTQPHTGGPQTAKIVPVFKPAVARSTTTMTPSYSAKVQLNFDKEPSDLQEQGSSGGFLQQAMKATVKPTFGGKAATPVSKSNHQDSTTADNAPAKAVKRKAQVRMKNNLG